MIRHPFLMCSAVALMLSACVVHAADEAKKKILFYSQSCGYRHSTVTRPITGEPAFAEKMMKEFGEKNDWQVSFSQDPHDLEHDGDFNRFDGIIFYTTGNPEINRKAFVKWLQSGKAFIGIHCGGDTFWHDIDLQDGGKSKGWPEYVRIVGGSFREHHTNDVPVVIKVEDKNSPATKHLGDEWTIADEIYQFNNFTKENVHPLLSIDTEKTNIEPQKMKKDQYYGVSWTREEGKGRVFYTSLGHRDDVWTNPKYQEHLVGGIKWALGQEK